VVEVYAYVADPENLPEWSSLAIEVKDTPEALGEGDRFTTVGKILGRRFETPFVRIGIEPNRRYTDRAAGGPVPDQAWNERKAELAARLNALKRCKGSLCRDTEAP
jgi:hypothetical protein